MSHSIVCHFQVDYWMCATELFTIHAIVLNHKTSLQCIHQDNLIRTETQVFAKYIPKHPINENLETITTLDLLHLIYGMLLR